MNDEECRGACRRHQNVVKKLTWAIRPRITAPRPSGRHVKIPQERKHGSDWRSVLACNGLCVLRHGCEATVALAKGSAARMRFRNCAHSSRDAPLAAHGINQLPTSTRACYIAVIFLALGEERGPAAGAAGGGGGALSSHASEATLHEKLQYEHVTNCRSEQFYWFSLVKCNN
jgi:hypothetical protein